MNETDIKKAGKILTFLYATIKISVRDLYVLPMGHIDSLLKMSGVLALITFGCDWLGFFSFLDCKGVLLACLILLTVKFASKRMMK